MDIPSVDSSLPKDVYKSVKCALHSVLLNPDLVQPKINQVVLDMNQHIVYAYQFIRSYLLDLYHKNQPFPSINKDFVYEVLKTIGVINGKKPKEKKDDSETAEKKKAKEIKKSKKLALKTSITSSFNDHFKSLMPSLPNYSNKTFLLQLSALEIITCIKTNLTTHFLDYLYKYVNIIFKDPIEDNIKKIKDKQERKVRYVRLNADVKTLKNALFNDDISLADSKYHEWFEANRPLLFPDDITNNIAYDVKARTQQYFKYAFYINEQIEKLNRRPYQVIPQRNDLIPKHITINTEALIALIDDKAKKIYAYGKSEMKNNIDKYQKHAWERILKFNRKDLFKHKNYVFFNQISTDGVSCTLLFIRKDHEHKNWGEKLPKITEDNVDVTKLNNMDKEECDEYLSDKFKLVGLDPGKRSIITMSDGTTNFSYSACQRLYETYAKRSNEIIQKEKAENGIINKETKLSNYTSRSLNKNKYNDFVKLKNIINEEVKSFYQRPVFRKLSFRRYCRTKQSEDNLLNNIEKTFLSKNEIKAGKKLVIGYGNWSRTKQMKGFISTPNKRIKKLMTERFHILSVEECMTSQLYNKTFKKLKKVYVKRKNGKHYRAVYGLLTPKEKTEKHIIVNRDTNAAKNMLYILEYYLKNQERPEEFKRRTVVKPE